MSYKKINEEELKNRIAQDYFSNYDCARIIGNIDFCVQPTKQPEPFEKTSLLWAEAKTGSKDVFLMFAQLILTIGKARTFTIHRPPTFLGVFDSEKMAFVPYDKIRHLFLQNDFNWNVAPSNTTTKEFAQIKDLVAQILESEQYLFPYKTHDGALRNFIKNNIAKGTDAGKIQIDKNNFTWVFNDWLKAILPLIDHDFSKDQSSKLIEANFFLADLFVDDKDTTTSEDDEPINDEIFVIFRNGHYEIAPEKATVLFGETLGFSSKVVFAIKDKAKYENFWKNYKRPPHKEYQSYILDRKDLLTPQDFRERKGAFFTPKQWVQLSQQYIADVFGEDWQDEYYVWDCCAGTGNLLRGLTNKRNIFASTIDQGDVEVMKGNARKGRSNLLENHIFQFDFLNDDFFDNEEVLYDKNRKKIKTEYILSKLPTSLQEIIRDPEKRTKLLVYINPPYAEATTARTPMGTGANKSKVATDNRTYEKYRAEIGKASNELFAQFLIRIYREIPTCSIANFAKLKLIQSSNFVAFREMFQAKLERLFLIPAFTFDNVQGQFPIGFFVWNGAKKESLITITADVYDKNCMRLPQKKIHSYAKYKRINQWIKDWDIPAKQKSEIKGIGYMENPTPDFQNNNFLNISVKEGLRHNNYFLLFRYNLIPGCVYFAIRHCIKATWLNDRDQFLYPKDSWEYDTEFHNDCLIFTLFHSQNRITSKEGENHWIPFTEEEVGAKSRFASTFMTDFINGKNGNKNGTQQNGMLTEKVPDWQRAQVRTFSPQATEVFNAGRELWKYYHAQKDTNVNASLYDIREYFQGRNELTKRMNNKSADETYNELTEKLKEQLGCLAEKIAEKVYEHGFLLG